MKYYKRIIAAMTAAAVALSAFSLTALARDITIGCKNSSENPNITLTLSDNTYESGCYSYSVEENSNCAVCSLPRKTQKTDKQNTKKPPEDSLLWRF